MQTQEPQSRILVVDDEQANLDLLVRFFASDGSVSLRTCADPTRALREADELDPDLVLLDLHMPHVDGFTVLQQLATRRRPPGFLPVIVLTADVSADAKRRALALGATDFLTKPLDLVEVGLRVANLLTVRRLQAELLRYQLTLEETVARRTEALVVAQREIVDRLGLAAEYRDDTTGRHTKRVGRLAAALAGSLGCTAEEVDLLRMAGPLHDIGKIAIPDAILLKPGKLTPAEYEVVKTHTTIGARILSASSSPVLRMAETIALAHHERWDGSGYLGLVGEEIPRMARIVAVVDVFDALVNERPYKEPWPESKALAEIGSLSGVHFDPATVSAFLGLASEGGLTAVP